MIQAAREDVNRLLRQWGHITQLLHSVATFEPA